MALPDDRRRRFLAATAANFFGLEPGAAAASLGASEPLARFLDDGGEFLLALRPAGACLAASNQVPAPGGHLAPPAPGPPCGVACCALRLRMRYSLLLFASALPICSPVHQGL